MRTDDASPDVNDSRALDRRRFLEQTLAACGALAAAACAAEHEARTSSADPHASESGSSADRARTAAKKRVLVLGGTRFIGPHVVEAALARGHAVTLFNRGKTHPELFPQCEKLRGDRDGDMSALSGREWDAVIDTWTDSPRHVRSAAELLCDHVGQYVFVSSLNAVLDLSRPGLDESAAKTPLDPADENSTDNDHFGGRKARCEDLLAELCPEKHAVALLPHVKTARLRALGVTSLQRWPALPDVPTIADQGFPGYDAINWYALFAPARTPATIGAKINTEVSRIVESPETRGRLGSLGLAPSAKTTPAEFSIFFQSEIVKWGQAVKVSGTTPD